LLKTVTRETLENVEGRDVPLTESLNRRNGKTRSTKNENYSEDVFANRKPISEVLHDIYDSK